MSLRQRISRMIRHAGPMPLAEFIHLALSDPENGYYSRQTAIGAKGDFITAPEVSQLFGELIGIWCVSAWQALGSPPAIALVEAGPGHGTLMADILRTAQRFADFNSAISVHLLETSPAMVARQRKRLSGTGHAIQWHASLQALPAMPAILIANELLDVLPFRQYVKSGKNWLENCIGLDGSDKLTFMLGAGQIDPALLPHGHEFEPDGSVFEVSPAREAFVQELCEHVLAHNGAALLIDYGHVKSGFGDTFQAVRAHKPTNPLEAPGDADLTSHVDFEPLKRLADHAGIGRSAIATQGEFLLAMGLLERAGILGSTADNDRREQIRTEVERLAAPNEMGNLFKVIGLWHGCQGGAVPDLPPFVMPKTGD
ncbi:MAG: class I SAM-dependent methyltransferase [Nitratireductor sp.]